jgi:TonB family protein
MGGTTSMIEVWKEWEGRVVNGQFPLQECLGVSDCSVVFLTERGAEKQKAAIKLIPADPKNMESQLSRWEAAARLTHPHLIRIFESGQDKLSNTPFLYVVMEHAEENLAQIVPHQELSPEQAREMLHPVLDALVYIHGNRFVHGHLRPGNILAVADQIKLSIDRLCTPNESGYGLEALRATAAYDAPEAESGTITPASDIWSLGVTLVEALTQRRPIWHAEIPTDPALPEGMPEPFLDIARHCLRLDPQDRWTPARIAARLEPAAPVVEQPAPTAEPETAAPSAVADSPAPAAPAPRVSAPRVQLPRVRLPRVRLPRVRLPKWAYLVPLVVAVFALAVLIGSKTNSSHPQTRQPRAAHTTAQATHAVPRKQQRRAETKRKPSATVSRTRKPAPIRETVRTKSNPEPAAAAATVAAGTGVKQPSASGTGAAVLHRVLPSVPQSARNTIHGHVRVGVKVVVDASGNVTRAGLESPGPSKYFARLALEASRSWKFTPVPSEWILRYAFGRTSTEVVPQRVGR